MPLPYLIRLVWDRKHKSIALLKRNAKGDYVVIGTCCSAVPYLRKTEISKKITLNFDRCYRYLKDCDDVTLIKCILYTNMDPINIPMILKN